MFLVFFLGFFWITKRRFFPLGNFLKKSLSRNKKIKIETPLRLAAISLHLSLLHTHTPDSF